MSRDCKKCGARHPPPTGKKCRWQNSHVLLQETEPQEPQGDMQCLVASVKALQEEMRGLQCQIQANPPITSSATSATAANPAAALTATSTAVSTPNTAPENAATQDDLAQQVRSRMATLQLLQDSGSDSEPEARPSSSRRKKGKKSGRARTAEDIVLRDIDWPHYHVYRGSNRNAARYEDLNVQEFTFGYLSCMRAASTTEDTRSIMLQHLQGLMQDATDYPWEGVRNAHGIILAQMEMGRLEWENREKILELRRTYAQRADVPATTGSKRQPPTRPSYTEGPVFCLAFQDGQCSHTGDHDTSRGNVKHICAYCLKATGHAYPHPEKKCRRKTGNRPEKNED